jgi:hypothetical protein
MSLHSKGGLSMANKIRRLLHLLIVKCVFGIIVAKIKKKMYLLSSDHRNRVHA